MEINKCLGCVGSCCSLDVEINKEDYYTLESLGLENSCTKHSTIFIKNNPSYKYKIDFLDNLYKDNFAILNKNNTGFCVFLDKDIRLCSIYKNRPKVCKEFSNKGEHCKKIYKCIN